MDPALNGATSDKEGGGGSSRVEGEVEDAGGRGVLVDALGSPSSGVGFGDA